MQPILKTEKLTHIFSLGTPFEHKALDSVDFEVYEGEFIGIIGHTGSGKSSFIQHLDGLLKPSSGSVYYRGEDIWAQKDRVRELRFKVGMVFQYPEHQLFEETVYQEVAFGPKNMGLDAAEVDARVREAVRFAGLDESVLERSPFELSGGQQRRVAIADVISMRPEVLILDEPTAGLDPAGHDSILQNIAEYHRVTGSTVILVSHNMSDIARLSERIYVLNDSRVAMSGTPAEVFSRAAELDSIGLDIPTVTRIMLRLRELGLGVDSAVYTVEQAAQQILRLKGGGADA